MSNLNKKYFILSPDGFRFGFDPFDTPAQAEQSLKTQLEVMQAHQGYYSTVRNGEREHIPIPEVRAKCLLCSCVVVDDEQVNITNEEPITGEHTDFMVSQLDTIKSDQEFVKEGV